MKTPEFFQARKEKREELKKYLPTDLQLEGEIKPTKWSFDGKLLTRRNVDAEEYRNFFEIVRLQNRGAKLTADERLKLEGLKEESMRVKKEIGANISQQFIIKKGLEQLAGRGEWTDYASLFKAAAEGGSGRGNYCRSRGD